MQSNPQGAIGSAHPEEAAPPAFTREELLAGRLRVTKVIPYQRSVSPFVSNLALAVFSGFLLVFAFPNWSLWSLGWVGTAPLILAASREGRFWRSMLLGTVTGTIFYAGTSHWVTYSMHNYGDLPLWLSCAVLLFFSSVLGLFTGLFAGLIGRAVGRLGGWAMLAAPAVWAAAEWGRLEITGMGWNALGYSQALQPAVVQMSRWGGVYIVSALMVTAATALVFMLVYLERLRGVMVLTAAGAVVVAAVLYGRSITLEPDESGSVEVVVVQPNIPVAGPWGDPAFGEEMLNRHVLLSVGALEGAASGAGMVDEGGSGHAAGHRGNVGLIIWPESPTNFEYDRDAELRTRVAEFTRENDVHLLMNSWGYSGPDDSSRHIHNSAMVIAPSGEKTSQYDKIALMPFGEYVPARGWLPFMDRVPALVADVTPGSTLKVVDAAGVRIGTSICFELTRPDIARMLRLNGASELVQLSNESWFGPSAAARQMLAVAVFRAVENNVDLIRATNSGLSARIDRLGGVYGETPMFETATRRWQARTAEEANRLDLTFYTRRGDVFALACFALSLLLGVGSLAPEGKENKTPDD